MPSLQDLLKRRPEVLEIDPEVRARVDARLATLRDSDPISTVEAEASSDDGIRDGHDLPAGPAAVEIVAWNPPRGDIVEIAAAVHSPIESPPGENPRPDDVAVADAMAADLTEPAAPDVARDLEDWDPSPNEPGLVLEAATDEAQIGVPNDAEPPTVSEVPIEAAMPIAAQPPPVAELQTVSDLPTPADASDGGAPAVANRSLAKRLFGKARDLEPKANSVETTQPPATTIATGQLKATQPKAAKQPKAPKPPKAAKPRGAKVKLTQAVAVNAADREAAAATPRVAVEAATVDVEAAGATSPAPMPEAATSPDPGHGLALVPPRPATAVSIRPRPAPTAGIATCPYCAVVLQPPPVASGRCLRCRQRIVVKHLAGRPIYLTEAALPVFEAERRRAVHAPRWTRQRDRWLALATASGASRDRLGRITRLPLSDEAVEAARTLYLNLVDRSVRDARIARRWDEAARLRFEQAMAMYRLAGSPKVLPDDVVTMHRHGLGSLLRSISEVAREAELRAGTCCDRCRADDGRTVRVAAELREPTLPHVGCAKGVCRCRWSLADRDRTIVSNLLRRHSRGARRRG